MSIQCRDNPYKIIIEVRSLSFRDLTDIQLVVAKVVAIALFGVWKSCKGHDCSSFWLSSQT